MKRAIGWLLLAAAAAPLGAQKAPSVPSGYQLVYEQRFDKPEALRDFRMTDPAAWKIAETNGNAVLELARQSQYQPPVRSPVNIALLREPVLGDFVLEVDLLQTGKEYGHRDMCLFFGFQQPSRFYYAHIATKADDHAHNIFVVNDAPRVKCATRTTAGVDWGLNVWHKVRVERTGGKIRVFFDDLENPVMEAENTTFGPGYIGFGSFDDTGMIDNIRIWAPSAEKKPAEFFKPALP